MRKEFGALAKMGGKCQSLSRVEFFRPRGLVAHQAPLSMGFSRRESWSGLPFPSPWDLPNPGIEHRSHALQRWILYHLSHQASPSGPPQSPGKTRVPQALPKPLSIPHQSCPSKAWGRGWERRPRCGPPIPPQLGGSSSWCPASLWSLKAILPAWGPPWCHPHTHQPGRKGDLDIPSSTTYSALSMGSCHHGPWPLPEPVPSLVLSLGCPSSRFLSGAQSASGPSSPECAPPPPGCRMSICCGTPDGTAGLTWLLRFQPSCSKAWGQGECPVSPPRSRFPSEPGADPSPSSTTPGVSPEALELWASPGWAPFPVLNPGETARGLRLKQGLKGAQTQRGWTDRPTESLTGQSGTHLASGVSRPLQSLRRDRQVKDPGVPPPGLPPQLPLVPSLPGPKPFGAARPGWAGGHRKSRQC